MPRSYPRPSGRVKRVNGLITIRERPAPASVTATTSPSDALGFVSGVVIGVDEAERVLLEPLVKDLRGRHPWRA